jgi:glycosyltransferase involved in cell wall biosynthesis
MACGTPVIAFRRGSAPELIRHGVTGFVVDTIDEMTDAVGAVDTIDPLACREHVMRSFSPSAMTEGYLRVYDWLLDRPRRSSSILVTPATTTRLADGNTDEVVAVA